MDEEIKGIMMMQGMKKRNTRRNEGNGTDEGMEGIKG